MTGTPPSPFAGPHPGRFIPAESQGHINQGHINQAHIDQQRPGRGRREFHGDAAAPVLSRHHVHEWMGAFQLFAVRDAAECSAVADQYEHRVNQFGCAPGHCAIRVTAAGTASST